MIALSGENKIPRGVPSSESVYLPPHNSPELRSFQDKEENPTRNLWKLDEVVNFVFSKKYQPKYYEIALKFLEELSRKLVMEGGDIGAFLTREEIRFLARISG